MSSTSLLESPHFVAARPRVDVHPPYEVSLGPVAVDLARRGGLVLDPWQADALDVMCAIRDDGQWACFEYGEIVSRQNGKGAILEARALAGLFLFGEELIMWSAHEYKTAMEGFRRVLAVLRRLGTRLSDNLYDVDGVLVKVINTNGEEGLERLDTGQRLRFIARSKGSGRGFSGDVNIIDEAFAFTREQQEALMPTMSARPNPQIIYTSSPPLTGDTGDVMYALRTRADAGGDDSLGWRDWGLAGDLDDLAAVDLDDERLWYQANPSLGGRLTVEYVRRERRSMSDVGFARERLGIWPRWIGGETGGAIPIDEWRAMVDPDSQASDDIAIAVDTTPDRAWSSIAIASPRTEGGMHLELIDHRRGTAWVVDRLVELKERHDPVAICLDAKGPAGSLLTDLDKAGIRLPADPERPERGDLIVPTHTEVAAACGQLLDAARDGTDRHIDQQQLTTAVLGATTRPLGDAVAWGRRQSDVDISPLVAVTLARWALLERAHLIDNEPECGFFFG